MLRQVVLRALKDVRDEDIPASLAAKRNVRDRAPVGRPRRHDVERAIDGEPLLVLAVVIREIDFLRRPLLNRAADALAVAIRIERDLRARDAGEAALLLMNFVRDRVRVQPRVGRRSGVLLAERLLLRVDLDQPHLHAHAVADLLHRADHEAVGVQLAPAGERHVGERRGPRNGGVGVARNQQELALEVQVVPQHLADRLRDRRRLGVGRERDEIGYGEPRRRGPFAADRDADLGGLLRRRLLRRLLRGLCARKQRERDERGRESGLQSCLQRDALHCLYWNTTSRLNDGFVKAAGSGGKRVA